MSKHRLLGRQHLSDADARQLSPAARKAVLLTEWGMPVPQAYRHPLSIGLHYFEFCDEGWNQPEAPNIWTWWSGPPASGFPNGYWDNDGFGLYSVKRGGNLPNDAPIWDSARNGPALPIDVHTERTELTSVLAKIYQTA